MSTAGKVLIFCVIIVSMAFLWLSTFVLEARNQWNAKVTKKADEVKALAEVVETLANGSPEGRTEFDKLGRAVLELGSDAARAEYNRRVGDGFDPKTAFEMALGEFLDKKVIDDYQRAVTALNDLENQQTIEEAPLEKAKDNFTAAERAFTQARNNLDTAYSLFLGQTLQQPGVRALKGLSIDAMRDTVARVQRAIAAQKTIFETQLSDAEKNLTVLSDRVKATQADAITNQQTASSAELERDKRTDENKQFEADLRAGQLARDEEIKKRDAENATLQALKKQYDQVVTACRDYVKRIKADEIQLEFDRGLKTVVVSKDGKAFTGKIQQIGEDGTVQVNLRRPAMVGPGAHVHVFRLQPEAQYLGLMEIIRSDSTGSVGRMLPEFRQRTLRLGDSVSTEIDAQTLLDIINPQAPAKSPEPAAPEPGPAGR
jgi:hypothetical protein